MRIGFDAGLFPASDRGGLGVYRKNLIDALARAGGGHQLVVYGRRPPVPAGLDVPGEGARGTTVTARDVGSGPLARLPGAYRQLVLPACARADGLDLVHFALGGASLVLPGLPAVVTVHDMLCLRSDELAYPVRLRGVGFRARKRYHRHAIPAGLRRARRLIANSTSTRDDVVRLLGIPADRIRVIPLAPDPVFERPPATAVVDAILRARGLERGYLLGFASIDPRKNAHRLLEAYAALPAATRDERALAVLLTQPHHERTLRALAASLGVGDRIRFVPFVPEAELPALYAGAGLLVFPSLHEGFGLPVLEAMATGTPVVASAVGGLPEVGGDAVRWIDPLDPAAIATAIAGVLGDPDERARMAQRGRDRAAGFRWDRAAAATLEVYREALA